MREFINIIENVNSAFSVTPEQSAKILSLPWVSLGVKIGKTARLWRGVSEESGSGMAVYGTGLYFTCDRSEAKKYGNVIEIPRSYLPQNPLRFRTTGDYQLWMQTVGIEILGYDDMREFATAYHDVRLLVQAIDPTLDGIQMFTGKDAMFVLYH